MKFVIAMALLFISTTPVLAEARLLAWVIDVEGWAHKIDVAGNKVVEKKTLPGTPSISTSLQEPDDAVVADPAANLLLLVNDYGRIGQWIGGYTLSDLKFVKKLDLHSADPEATLPKILAPAASSQFYVYLYDAKLSEAGESAEVVTAFSKATFTPVPDGAASVVNSAAILRYSPAGDRIYAIDLAGNRIVTYDARSFQQLASDDIGQLWSAGLLERHLDDFQSGKLLFRELVTTPTGTAHKYFQYDVAAKLASNKVTIMEDGYGVLSANGSKLFVVQNGVSKVNIYDARSGLRLKALDLTGRFNDLRIMHKSTVSPDNSKLYLQGESVLSGTTTVVVVDIASMVVSAELDGVTGANMIFFNE